MIPVLGVPYLNKPELLLSMLDSIDVPVETTVIVDNSVNADLKDLDRPNTRVLTMHHNMGVAASWNLIIKNTPAADWWLITNSDVKFVPGNLSGIAADMDGFDGVVLAEGFAVFGISPYVVANVGWFDENFVPAYFEDNDYAYRCRLAGVPVVSVGTGIRHYGSSTLRDDLHLQRQNEYTFPANAKYYEAKWGGEVHHETFTRPFDGRMPATSEPNIQRLAALTWRL